MESSQFFLTSPFIVGPFHSSEYKKILDRPFDSYIPSTIEIEKEQQKWKTIKVPI